MVGEPHNAPSILGILYEEGVSLNTLITEVGG